MDDWYWSAGFWAACGGTAVSYLMHRFCTWAFEVADEEEEK